MEVEVLRHNGIPESSILSIRVGSTRRQVHVSQLDRPLKFPTKLEECSSVKVEILDVAGTARVSCSPSTSEYSIPLESPLEGEGSTGMEVGIRLGGAGAEVSPGAVEEAEKKKEDDAKSYLEKHGLTSFMQFLIQSLMKDKPEDPYKFLQRQVTKKMMITELSSGVSADQKLEEMLTKLSSEVTDCVPVEQLQDLQKQAEEVGDQLRKDNKELRETLDLLKGRYRSLLVENSELAQQARLHPAGGIVLDRS
ncbi:C07A9.2 [Symbiodinium sp. CCMP2456]|nr:C07A9.2 [Symbiodinium sp. CCMP2456]